MSKSETTAKKDDLKAVKYVPDPARVKAMKDRIVACRLGMLIKAPFWGTLAVRLTIKDATGWCSTAATDGRCIYFNIDFFEKLTDQEITFVLAHEVEHCVFAHFLRRENRDPKIWNIAGDYVINLDLFNNNIGKLPREDVVKVLFDKQFAGMSTEQVYKHILDNQDDFADDQTMDEHLEPANEGCDGDGYEEGDENNAPKMSKSAGELIEAEMRSAVIDAASVAENSKAGNVPDAIKRLIKEWTESKIDWRSYITEMITASYKEDFSWLHYNKRSSSMPMGQYGRVLLAGRKPAEKVLAHIAVDTSGSMSDGMLSDLLGEARGVLQQFTSVELHVWCFDTVVYPESYKVYTEDNLQEIEDYELHGGGGTDFEANWSFMKEKNIKPSTFIMFTDGYPFGSWGDPEFCPSTIFLIHGNTEIKAPFGTTLYYDESPSE